MAPGTGLGPSVCGSGRGKCNGGRSSRPSSGEVLPAQLLMPCFLGQAGALG